MRTAVQKHHNQFPLHFAGAQETFLRSQQVAKAPGARQYLIMTPGEEEIQPGTTPAITGTIPTATEAEEVDTSQSAPAVTDNSQVRPQ